MTIRTLLVSAGALALVACGGSLPEPKEGMTQAEAAVRSAAEVGAEKNPQATLHLKYAKDQVDEAKKLIAENDNGRAEYVLMRARADAELALMLAKANNQKAEAQRAADEVAEMRRKLGK